MNITLELRMFAAFLLLISLAEIITYFIDPLYGLFIHSVLLVSLVLFSTFMQKTSGVSNLFLCLSIAPLIRLFSLSLPLAYLPTYTWYLIAGVPMFMAAVTMIKLQHLRLNDIGLTIKKPSVQLLIMLTGIPFGIVEYFVLKPAPLATGLSVFSLVLLSFALIIATGFVEELVFRGVFQKNAVNVFGPKIGLIAVSVVFAILHIGWLNLFDVLLVFFIGLFFGVLMLKTGSIAGISLSHGLTNVFLFVIMPSVNFINA